MLNAELKILVGKHQGKVIPLTVKRFLVGREQDCQLRPNSDMVSRHHCAFTLDDYAVRLRDLGSTNGTRVNGELIRGEVPLKSGDHISIGKLDLELVIRAGKAVQPAYSAPSRSVLDDSAVIHGNATVEMPAFNPDAPDSVYTESNFESPTSVRNSLSNTAVNSIGETVILSPQAIPPMVMPAGGKSAGGPPSVSAPAVGHGNAAPTGIFPTPSLTPLPPTVNPAKIAAVPHVSTSAPSVAPPTIAHSIPAIPVPPVATPPATIATAIPAFSPPTPQPQQPMMPPAPPMPFPMQAPQVGQQPMMYPGMPFPNGGQPGFAGFPGGFPQMMPQQVFMGMPGYPQMGMPGQMPLPGQMPGMFPQMMPQMPMAAPVAAAPVAAAVAEPAHAAPAGNSIEPPPLRLPPPEETGAKEVVKPPEPAAGAAPAAPTSNPRSAAEEIIRKMRAGRGGA